MENQAYPSLEKIESDVKITTLELKKTELNIIENLLNKYLYGFRLMREFKIGEISRLELSWLLLVIRAFNSLRCSYDLLQKGYYTQASILIRSAEEDYITCRHCEICPETVEALLTGNPRMKRFNSMAKDISTKFYESWKVNYGQLSEIAHPRQLAMGMIANWEESKMNLGANYIEDHFIAVSHALLKTAVSMTEFLVKLLGDNAEQWRKESYQEFRNAYEYIERISNAVHGTTK